MSLTGSRFIPPRASRVGDDSPETLQVVAGGDGRLRSGDEDFNSDELVSPVRRSTINQAHRLNLKAPYPKDRVRPSFPPKSWTPAEKLLAQALLELFRFG